MASIQLSSAAKHYRELSHQAAAWNWLQQQIDPKTLEQFAEMFRADPPVKPESSPAPGVYQAWMSAALKIIKEFEGCILSAYPDPETNGDPWTIGWGATKYENGVAVKRGDSITQQVADSLLAAEINKVYQTLQTSIPCWVELNPNQQAALVSFSYNCGSGWYGSSDFSTITSRVKSKEFDKVSDAMMLYVNPGGPSEAGLRRRRTAEGALFSLPSTPEIARPKPLTTNPLSNFPWFPQLDNGPEGYRQCQTSSIAMCLAYLKIPGIKDDTDYLKIVNKYGDTTVQASHQQALKELNVRARFRQNMTAGELMAEIKGGLPVAIGILHKGPVSAPNGGGHYITVFGFNNTHWIVNDPYGEIDLVNGGFAKTGGASGRNVQYSFKNMNPRWLPEGQSSGWAWIFS